MYSQSSLTLELPGPIMTSGWPGDMASSMCPSGADSRRDRCAAAATPPASLSTARALPECDSDPCCDCRDYSLPVGVLRTSEHLSDDNLFSPPTSPPTDMISEGPGGMGGMMSVDSCLDLPGPAVLDSAQLALIEPVEPPSLESKAQKPAPAPVQPAAEKQMAPPPAQPITTSVSSVAKPREGKSNIGVQRDSSLWTALEDDELRAGIAAAKKLGMRASLSPMFDPVSDLPCSIRREGGQSLVIGGSSLVILEGKACNPL
jgi:hypothetical protein